MGVARHREFDADAALDRAVEVFWEHGYDGASLAQLTAAMGISKPSLYAAFGDKRQLFEKAVRRYSEGGPAWERKTFDLPTAREVITTYLHRTVDAGTRAGQPRGCLLVQSAGKLSPESQPVRAYVARQRADGLVLMRERLKRAADERDPTMTSDPDALTLLVSTLADGIAVRANDGTPPAELHRMVDLAIEGLFA